LVVAEGRMQFEGSLVRDEEMLAENASFSYIDIDGAERTIPLTAGTLAYTYCQIPIVLKRSRTPCLRITKTSGTTELQGTVMTPEDSRAVFERSGEIVMIEAEI